MAERAQIDRSIAGQLGSMLKFLDGFRVLTVLLINLTQKAVRYGEIRIEFQGFADWDDSLLVAARPIQPVSHVNSQHQVQRIQSVSASSFSECFVKTAEFREQLAVPLVCV